MAERGHEVGLATAVGSPLALRSADLAGAVALFEAALGPKLGRRSVAEFLWNARRYRRELCELVARRSGQRWDVVHMQYKKEQLLGTGALAARGYPVAWTEHGGLPPGLVSTPLARVWYQRAARAAAGIASVSRYVACCLAGAGVTHPRSRIIHNAVDERAFLLKHSVRAQYRADVLAGLKWPAGAIVVGTICRFAPRKGLEHLVAAALSAMSTNDLICLLMVGDGDERAPLEAMVPDALRSRTTFTGFQRNVPRYLSATDVFVSPTVDPTEGFPLRVVEAMTAGVAVIATRVGGQPEAIMDGRTGILVSPNDLSELTRAIEWMTSHESERIEMAVHARREAVERFGIRTFAAAHEAFLMECSESRLD